MRVDDCLTYSMTVATRNIADFAGSGASAIDPWAA